MNLEREILDAVGFENPQVQIEQIVVVEQAVVVEQQPQVEPTANTIYNFGQILTEHEPA